MGAEVNYRSTHCTNGYEKQDTMNAPFIETITVSLIVAINETITVIL